MALNPCSECRNPVSEKAAACPRCGCPAPVESASASDPRPPTPPPLPLSPAPVAAAPATSAIPRKVIILIVLIVVLFQAVWVMRLITAILIPAQQDYKIREKVSEGAILGDGSKTAMAEFYSNKNSFPSANVSAGVAAATSITANYVSSVTIDKGTIKVTYGNHAVPLAPDKTLEFEPTEDTSSPSWKCTASGSTVSAKYRPTVCRP